MMAQMALMAAAEGPQALKLHVQVHDHASGMLHGSEAASAAAVRADRVIARAELAALAWLRAAAMGRSAPQEFVRRAPAEPVVWEGLPGCTTGVVRPDWAATPPSSGPGSESATLHWCARTWAAVSTTGPATPPCPVLAPTSSGRARRPPTKLGVCVGDPIGPVWGTAPAQTPRRAPSEVVPLLQVLPRRAPGARASLGVLPRAACCASHEWASTAAACIIGRPASWLELAVGPRAPPVRPVLPWARPAALGSVRA